MSQEPRDHAGPPEALVAGDATAMAVSVIGDPVCPGNLRPGRMEGEHPWCSAAPHPPVPSAGMAATAGV